MLQGRISKQRIAHVSKREIVQKHLAGIASPVIASEVCVLPTVGACGLENGEGDADGRFYRLTLPPSLHLENSTTDRYQFPILQKPGFTFTVLNGWRPL
jgi:hypothetical protein